MKYSKIYLAVTTAILAVAGFISVKAHKKFGTLSFYSLRNTACTRVVSKNAHEGTGVVIGYTQYSQNPCTGKTIIANE